MIADAKIPPSMEFLPFRRMIERVARAGEDSDTSLFLELMYYGELITKLTTVALVSAILNDKERHRYRYFHRLVRADGIGEWSEVLDATLTGPASQFLQRQARVEQRELTQRCKAGTWQHESVRLLNICLTMMDPSREELPSKVDGRRLFSLFAELRNKTRGHGAHTATQHAKFCSPLKSALVLFAENHSLFQRPWVYLHRNLSGKYRVTQLGAQVGQFESLKSDRSVNLPNGVYVYFDRPALLELVFSDAEATDFWVPNGGFTGKRFEVISYISGQTKVEDASNYLAPATELPPSETEGIGTLEVQGNCFGNLPPIPPGYVHRPALEKELTEKLVDERHPMITLAGRGGIGKTSLALAAIHELSSGDRFGAMLWFSARDIDLLQEGPKVVRPHVLSEGDIADEFVRLVAPGDAMVEGFEPIKYLAGALAKSPIGVPLLFAIDNFETVRSPTDLFTWLDTYIRSPNKVLITTRFRDFKGDYPVEVVGMTDEEAQKLITSTAISLGVHKFLTKDYGKEVIRESDGHPYVIKILLGEVAKANRLVALKPVVSSQEEILDALFERTFAGLSPAAKRIFFLLSSWRSTIPELAIHAVLARPSSEHMRVEEAIEELRKSSLIDTATSPDRARFLSVPLVAAEFGKRKLAASPSKSAVEADLELLHHFGPGQKSDLAHGIAPKVARLFRQINAVIKLKPEELEKHLPILEFVAQNYPLLGLISLAYMSGQGCSTD
jgi:NB-ARC domain